MRTFSWLVLSAVLLGGSPLLAGEGGGTCTDSKAFCPFRDAAPAAGRDDVECPAMELAEAESGGCCADADKPCCGGAAGKQCGGEEASEEEPAPAPHDHPEA